MIKRYFKPVFYIVYFGAGYLISFFFPDHVRYIVGFIQAFAVAWCWKVITTDTINDQFKIDHD